MNNMCDLNKMLVSCTLGEFAEAVAMALAKQQPQQDHFPDAGKMMPKGIKGIMSIFGVGDYTARKIVKSGVIDDAIYHISARTFLTDPDKAKELYKQYQA